MNPLIKWYSWRGKSELISPGIIDEGSPILVSAQWNGNISCNLFHVNTISCRSSKWHIIIEWSSWIHLSIAIVVCIPDSAISNITTVSEESFPNASCRKNYRVPIWSSNSCTNSFIEVSTVIRLTVAFPWAFGVRTWLNFDNGVCWKVK